MSTTCLVLPNFHGGIFSIKEKGNGCVCSTCDQAYFFLGGGGGESVARAATKFTLTPK